MYKVYFRIIPVLLVGILIVSILAISACGDQAQGYLEQGDEFSASEQWNQAIEEYGKAIEQNPDLALAYLGRAKAYSAQEEHELAVYDLNMMLEVTDDPNLILDAVQMIEDVESDVLATVIGNIAASVSEIRGLVPKHKVDYLIVTPEEMQEKILDIFETEYSREEAAIDQEVYELLDLLDEGQDLYSILLDLYSEQVVGLYDRETDKLYVVGDVMALGPMERVSLAHEYTHALQDQYFDLSTLLLEDGNNSDMVRAAQALIEGDASLTHSKFMQEELSTAELLTAIADLEESDLEKYENSPQFLKEELLFPYIAGQNFVMELGDWEAVNSAYADPPQTTEQILHPEMYEECEGTGAVLISDLREFLDQFDEGWAEYYRDVFGEFYIKIWLETYIDSESAVDAAQGWDDDVCVYYKNDAGEQLLVFRSDWDSEKDAEEFFNTFITYMEKKDGGIWELTFDEDDVNRRWDKDGQIINLYRHGTQNLIIISPNEVIGGLMWQVFTWSMEASDYPDPPPDPGG